MVAIFMIIQKYPYNLHHEIHYMNHHLRQYHIHSLPHNQTQNFHFHSLVKTEIHSNFKFKVFDQSISTDLDHLQYFNNNTLSLIPDRKTYFKCTTFCRYKELQIHELMLVHKNLWLWKFLVVFICKWKFMTFLILVEI